MTPTLSTLNLSIFTCILMLIIQGLLYYNERDKRHLHTLEFWVAYAFYFIVSFMSQSHGPYVVALSTIAWIWRTKTITSILSDVSGMDLRKDWHWMILVAGYTFGAMLAFTGIEFKFFTIPPALANFLIGVSLIQQTRRSLKFQDERAITHKLLLLNVFIISAHLLDYPFIRYNHEWTGFGFAVVLITTILMAIILPAVTIYELQKANQRTLETLLNERAMQLKEQAKFQALGEMTAGIVHEINSPLSLITHRATHLRGQLMRDEAEKDVLMKNLYQIETTGERMAKIVNSLRKFSKDSHNEPLKTVALASVIEETLSYCTDRFYHSNILLDVEPYPARDIECKPIQISQVFLNLLNNSYDAVRNQTENWVKIDFEELEETIRIRVSDSGKGIPEVIKSKIMDPFFTTKSAGTGLGLSISKGIIEDHKGKLYYDEGAMNTTFVVELPYRQG